MNNWMEAINDYVRREFDQPQAFQCFYFKASKGGGMIVRGAIPTRRYTKGPRKGEPDFRRAWVQEFLIIDSFLRKIEVGEAA